jgi:spore coat protein U-like protein
MKRTMAVLMMVGTITAAGRAGAATVTNNLQVSASVAGACQIQSVSNIAFGVYNPLNESPTDASGNLVFKCVKNTSYKTYLAGVRKMTGGQNTLDFEVYSDPARTSLFPSAISGGSTTAPDLKPITTNLYGRIPVQQNVGPGSYSAGLVATVEY